MASPGPKGLLIAGTHSGCGKTTVTLGLLKVLSDKGYRVQSFKTGPDFIDPGLHSHILGRPSHNLDIWMMGEARVRELIRVHSRDVDIVLVEGAMGLFDGIRGDSEEASGAELAKILGLDVLLVVDGSSMGRSVAALVKGFIEYDPGLTIVGLVLNRVGSERHEGVLKAALAAKEREGEWGLPVKPWLAGCLHRDHTASISSRHLGLVTAEDEALHNSNIAAMAGLIQRYLDVDGLVSRLSSFKGHWESQLNIQSVSTTTQARVNIAIARDQAFCFYYQDTLDLLEQAGCCLVPFSPINDPTLPKGCSGLYLGGGYPELHGQALTDNTSMRRAIRTFSEEGGVVYAECGGFMYLLEELTDRNGTPYAMCGALPGTSCMQERFQELGYREVSTTRPSILGDAVTVVRGHAFHYSQLTHMKEDLVSPIYKLRDKDGWMDRKEGFLKGNTLGSYVHLHFGGNPEVISHLVQQCRDSEVIT